MGSKMRRCIKNRLFTGSMKVTLLIMLVILLGVPHFTFGRIGSIEIGPVDTSVDEDPPIANVVYLVVNEDLYTNIKSQLIVYRSDLAGKRYTPELKHWSSGVAKQLDNDDKILPTGFVLRQNHPNQFNPVTTIEAYMLVSSGYSLSIYNIAGQKVEQFTGFKEAGVVKINWDASSYASGVYFYRFDAG